MATFTETADSRRFTENTTFEIRGKVTGTASHSTAVSTAKAATSASEGSLIRDDVIAEPEYIDTTSEADCVWLVTVPYKDPTITPLPQSDIGDVTISGDIMGVMTNIKLSKGTDAYPEPTNPGDPLPPNFKGLINVGQDGRAEGVEIELPAFDFTVTKVWASGSLPSLATLYAIKLAPVNSDSFTVTDSITGMSITVAAGACLFRGVQFAAPRQDGAVEFTYRFSVSLNETSSTVGGITVDAKAGWQYVWAYSEKEEDGDAIKLITRPVAVYVETVYDTTAFSAFGL